MEHRRFALFGNPNTGKTTLFNRLCGMRARTGNYPGITVAPRIGTRRENGTTFEFTDLPGLYSLGLTAPEAEYCRRKLRGEIEGDHAPEAVVVVVDASNLARNLVLLHEVAGIGLPLVLALNMTDLAERRGLSIDRQRLAAALGCPVIPINARDGQGVAELVRELGNCAHDPSRFPSLDSVAARLEWAEKLVDETMTRSIAAHRRTNSDRLDAITTHSVWGVVVFIAVMTGLFMTIFWLADLPMQWIGWLFERLSGGARALLPEGLLVELVVGGIINGVAGTVVFLPQICLLFFLLSLLEDTGYLARAAFVTDRLMRRFGLPGQAFVPLLSSHACALPGILCARLIPDRSDRLTTILVAPFMSCSARLPVYVLLISLLFAGHPVWAGLAFTGCYLLGAGVALLSALLARRTILPGRPRPMILELPSYKRPSLRTALLTAGDNGWLFLKKAGTVILAICIVMWWLTAFPRSGPGPAAIELETRAATLATLAPEESALLSARAARLAARNQLAGSFAGRIGRTVEPVLAPIGCDWQMSIAVMTSFLAREVFVSSMAVVIGAGEGVEGNTLLGRVRAARRDDGSPLLSPAAAAGLLVFYVLAMQCLPTLAVTRRETGSWKWAALQLGYMSSVAWVLALVTFHGLHALGVG